MNVNRQEGYYEEGYFHIIGSIDVGRRGYTIHGNRQVIIRWY